jgi:hypothetical protein
MEIKPGLYRHFKGALYWVVDVATHSETEEPLVIYRSAKDPTRLWARPMAMFCEEVEHQDRRVPRFEPVEPEGAPTGAGWQGRVIASERTTQE